MLKCTPINSCIENKGVTLLKEMKGISKWETIQDHMVKQLLFPGCQSSVSWLIYLRLKHCIGAESSLTC